jgi:hypothetical protein
LEDDPICNSSGCTQYKHPPASVDWPKNYGVPSFGVDQDILATQASYKTVEGNMAEFDPKNLEPHDFDAHFKL